MSMTTEMLALMVKELGKNATNQAVSKFIDTGYPPLNEAISGHLDGGLPCGRLMEMFGESSSGKTALATQWMAEAQKMGGVAVFIDWERSFDVGLAENFGLNTEPGYWFYYQPKTWEEGNMQALKAVKFVRENKIIPADAPILVVFDSIAAALPKSMAEKEMDEYSMNDTTALARVTSTTLKTMASKANEYEATMLYLNQMRLKPGVVYGDPRTTPGGKAMEFYATVRMALGKKKIMEQVGGEKTFAGQEIAIQCVKSKLTKPFKECAIRMTYDEMDVARFDVTTSLLEYLVEKGKLVSSGVRIAWTDGKQYYKKALAEKIDTEKLYPELVAMCHK